MELKEKAVSKKQQRFFGMVRAAQKGEGAASPEVAKVASEISKKDAKDFAKTKHKGLPEKKKIDERFGEWKQAVKDRDKAAGKKYKKKSINRKKKWREGGHEKLKDVNKPAEKQSIQRVGGSRGVHTANRKSKASQGKPAPVVYSYKKKVSEGLSVKDAKKLNKASALSYSDNPKDQDRARARQTEVDYKDLLRQIKKRKKMKEQNELAGKFKIDTSAHKKVQKKAKLRNLAKGNTNPNEKAAAQKKAGGPKLIGEVVKGEDTQRRKDDAADRKAGKGKLLSKKTGDSYAKWTMAKHPKAVDEEENFSQRNKELKATKKARDERHRSIHSGTNTSKNTDVNEGRSFADWKKAAGNALKRKKEERKAQPATDAGARARRKLKDKEHKKYVNFLPAEDD